MGLSQLSSQNGPKRLLGPLWCMCWRKFRTSGTYPVPWLWNWHWRSNTSSSHGCVRCPGNPATASYDLGSRADVITGRYSVSRPLALDLTLNVKWQVKDHVCVRCQNILAIVWDHFDTRVECSHNFGSYAVSNPLILNLALKMILKIRLKSIFVLIATNVI